MSIHSSPVFKRLAPTFCALICLAGPLAAQETTIAFKPADSAAIEIFEPYIGRWISPPRKGQQGENQFIIDYHWFDANHSVVKLIITRRVVGEDEEQLQWEGFYGVHPLDGYIYYHGVNVAGVSSIGGIVEFARDTGARTSRYQGRTPAGETVNVRDVFTVIDKKSWRSVTNLKRGDGEWRTISDTVYSRLED